MGDAGYMYLLAIGPDAEILDKELGSPYVSAIETSIEGQLGYIRLPATATRLRVPSGVAVRVPAMLGCRLAQNSRWRDISEDEFYRLGLTRPDPYELQSEVLGLQKQLKVAEQSVQEYKDLLQKAGTKVKALEADVEALRPAPEPEVPEPVEVAEEEEPPQKKKRKRGR